jgi:multidrug efflux pump
MRYLPITLVATLSASLVMAMVFVPVLGAMFGRPQVQDEAARKCLVATENGDLSEVRGWIGAYVRLLAVLIRRPLLMTLAGIAMVVASWWAYAAFGRGVEFFPDVEPEKAQVLVHARGDTSVLERDALVREVEARILGIPGIEHAYARTALSWRGGEDIDEDVVGLILLEFTDWKTRAPGEAIMAEIRARTAGIPGILVETRVPNAGPPSPRCGASSTACRGSRTSPTAARCRESSGSSTSTARPPPATVPTSPPWARPCACSPTASRSRPTAPTTPTTRSTSWRGTR